MFKNRKINKKTIYIVFIILFIPTISFARYYQIMEKINVSGNIAEPIFEIESLSNTIISEINKESKIEEYIFEVKNFKYNNDSSSKRISEVDMEYNIEIINENPNFPIAYKLCEYEKEDNLLNEKNKTETIKITSNKEFEKKYKLTVYWSNKAEQLDSKSNIKILINSTQSI